ncbi:DUF4834 family protein [Parabacteroides sp. 52]|uniref:DUF4834 family protein n=1 Tax=unclassified Parabacteroides TaxID=2649774 RepID=UPI0013D00EDA|nr:MULTISPECIES: DUF4834 family protein [unclassified Parabacteroides]MDH6534340.1 hypothetical protein [Parabacteroides sp. PM5-20]NDV54838.1 DUF4834 family protein [Parabacteroides sp. 52]
MIRFLLIIVFFVFILMFLAGFSVLRTFKSIFFGGDDKKNNQRTRTKKNTSGQSHNRQGHPGAPARKKIFPKEEGEYVDYEEVE